MTRKLRHVVSLGEIADKFAGGTPATVTNWRTRYSNFPAPRRPGSRPLFNLDEIVEWYLWEGPGRRRDLKSEAHSWDDPAWRWTKTVQAFRAVADGADITSNLVALIALRHALVDRGIDAQEWSALVESTDPESILPGLIGRVERADRNLYGLLTPAGAVPESAHPYLHDVLADLDATSASSTSAELVDAVLAVRDEFLVTRHASSATSVPLARCIVAAAQLEPGMSVLDPAVGEGALVLGAARSLQGRLTILGGDNNRAALRIARSRLYVNGFDEYLVKTEVDSLVTHEFADVTADVVLLDPPVDKTQRVDTWLRFAVEHVKPGGRAVVAIPASSLVGVKAARRQPDLRVRRYLEEIRGTAAVTAAVVLPRNWRTDVVGPLVILVVERTARDVPELLMVSALDVEPINKSHSRSSDRIVEWVERAFADSSEGGVALVPLSMFFETLEEAVTRSESAAPSRMSLPKDDDFSDEPVDRVYMAALINEPPRSSRNRNMLNLADQSTEARATLLAQLEQCIAPLHASDPGNHERALWLIAQLRRLG
jgi:2-polyprenyl-3-methyl-5-hydroxy-6-metoxy-1,4-benzoquinol methylase